MLTGLLAGVLTGWVLSLFDLHLTVIEFIQRFTDKHLTITDYYIIFGLIGLIYNAIRQ